MKKIKLTHVLLSLLFGVSATAAGSYPALKHIWAERAESQQDILQLNQALYTAILSRDFTALQALLTNDFEMYLTNGEVLSKQEWIKLIQRRAINFSEMEQLNTDLQGNSSSGLLRVDGQFLGQEKSVVVEMNIRTIVKNAERQIKCIVVKEV